MNKILAITIPLALLAIAATVGGIIIFNKHHTPKPIVNHTTIFDWYACSNGLEHAQCDDLSDETKKSVCYNASNIVSELTYSDSEHVLEACAKFAAYLKTASAQDELNSGSFYENCYLNKQVTKNAATCSYYNEKIYTPFYVKCAGF
ncbi:transmembrane protein, putative (macronuclear) [Tetrahymena thermophila SB210]|uniref:Transmembrane protein, putative n=1 Tax=Tetrahymena thermophila (strain SB210) TaxID=312017 RepID=Q22NY1_TETTS|nr:transmembrane protein, putative [Tetrahymena thermophila SB210]EAR87030.1 transmembrane protein, putative [Tetrahymena thermophila SB210]|eukprot:XP_001007275.1 transmembrane protein, putative [Tetrahymena thermophila SB210]